MTLLVVNPTSGNDAAAAWLEAEREAIERTLGPLEVALTGGPGDGERAAAVAARNGCSLVVVVGGDGTFNEAVNGVLSAGALARTTFGLIPQGTGNDLARALQIPSAPSEALELVAAGVTRRLDLGLMNGRAFANASAGGLLAEASAQTSGDAKARLGPLAYVVGGVQALLEHEPLRADVTVEGIRHAALELQFFIVSNAPFIGGGRRVAPMAAADDGCLDVCLVQSTGVLDLLPLLNAVASGDHLGNDRVLAFTSARTVLRFDRAVKVNTDGEVAEAQACRYRVLPRALRVAAPAVLA